MNAQTKELLSRPVTNLAGAVAILEALQKDGLAFHPEDSVAKGDGGFTLTEAKQRNARMTECYALTWPSFCGCPCACLFALDAGQRQHKADMVKDEPHAEDRMAAKLFLQDCKAFDAWRSVGCPELPDDMRYCEAQIDGIDEAFACFTQDLYDSAGLIVHMTPAQISNYMTGTAYKEWVEATGDEETGKPDPVTGLIDLAGFCFVESQPSRIRHGVAVNADDISPLTEPVIERAVKLLADLKVAFEDGYWFSIPTANECGINFELCDFEWLHGGHDAHGDTYGTIPGFERSSLLIDASAEEVAAWARAIHAAAMAHGLDTALPYSTLEKAAALLRDIGANLEGEGDTWLNVPLPGERALAIGDINGPWSYTLFDSEQNPEDFTCEGIPLELAIDSSAGELAGWIRKIHAAYLAEEEGDERDFVFIVERTERNTREITVSARSLKEARRKVLGHEEDQDPNAAELANWDNGGGEIDYRIIR